MIFNPIQRCQFMQNKYFNTIKFKFLALQEPFAEFDALERRARPFGAVVNPP
jgi:hypothetical protein